MDFKQAMDKAIASGLTNFKQFLQQKVRKNDAFLHQSFWVTADIHMTVLNYLIEQYQEADANTWLAMIDEVVALSQDNNIGEPLHQAVATGKNRLVLHLLAAPEVVESEHAQRLQFNPELKKRFDVDKRDKQGRTLLSLILSTKNEELLRAVLAKNPNIHATTYMAGKILFQSIHQAIALDFPQAVILLAQYGACLDNPFGELRDTPLLLAARLGKINALTALLEQSTVQLNLEKENKHLLPDNKAGHRAIEELCNHLSKNHNRNETIRGIAMLLCHGAEVPRSDAMRDLLGSYRMLILQEVHRYMEHKPELVDAFVNRCHLKDSPLNTIMYARHSWGNSIRHLFGIPSSAAFVIEELVTRKATKSSAALVHADAVELSKEKDKLKLYAEFVRRYTQAYESQTITNRWSTMRWMIAEGGCDWSTVLDYSQSHPTSRTRIIINEMFRPLPKVHEHSESYEEPSTQESLPANAL